MFLSFQICYGTITLSPSPAGASSSSPYLSHVMSKVANPSMVTCCSRLTQQVGNLSPELHSNNQFKPNSAGQFPSSDEPNGNLDAMVDGKESSDRISGIQVPRTKDISASKSALLNAIVSTMFESQVEAEIFIHLSNCLDSILHAEHKCTLEEMRVDYELTHSLECKGTIYKDSSSVATKSVSDVKESESEVNFVKIDSREEDLADKVEGEKLNLIGELHSQLDSLSSNAKGNSLERVSVHTRFQRAFVQLLYNAEFQELSVRDLLLTSALNTDYLLTLPIYVDWKRAYDSNAIIYRRGYTTEKQKGLLTGEKLDYLQSKLLQRIFFLISQTLGKVGIWLTEVIGQVLGSTVQKHDIQVWADSIKLWLEKLPLSQQSYSRDESASSNQVGIDNLIDSEVPIWLAAQRAVTRYEGILSATGPRSRLLRRFLVWIGVAPSIPNQAFDRKSKTTGSVAESFSRPIFLPRVSISDIWEPASWEYCGNDFWKILKTAISILLSQSTLEEPAFEELILLYTKDLNETGADDKVEIPSLQLKIYENIPIPDLPVIFPHKKLSFRILDTVRLDVATILGLLAYFINYKFEDILSSPSAILLDGIAVSALVIFVTRVVLGYKQTRDRYQLLVNRTLYEKTVASGFGSVHFLLDASEQQLYKEAILTYAILLKAECDQVSYARSVGDKCEKFICKAFNEKIEMPIDKAKDTLSRLGLVVEKIIDGEIVLQAIPCSRAYQILRERWNTLLA